MNTKRCKKCNWVYPIDWPGRKCRFCQEPFIDGPCNQCGKYSEKLHNGICRSCHTIMHRNWRNGRRDAAATSLDKWLDKIKALPYPSPTLTEDEWMEACSHFNGCAYCGSTEIDARSMFIPFKEGGRYCAWNVIPACEKCETARKATSNPFLRMDNKYRRGNGEQAKKYGFTLNNLSRIVDYLQSKMEVKQ